MYNINTFVGEDVLSSGYKFTKPFIMVFILKNYMG